MSKITAKRFQRPITLIVGQTQTPEINIPGEDIIGFHFDANLTGTVLTLQAASVKGGTFDAVKDNSGALSLTVSSSSLRGLSADELSKVRGLENFKITMGTTQATTPAIINVITRQTA